MPTLTVHTIVRNDDRFVGYAVRSVIDFVDQVLVFDTGSTDNTKDVLETLVRAYPSKVRFEAKGPSDKKRHTALRQEMLERTRSEWFMILDGDEVWTNRGISEATQTIGSATNVDFLISPYYNCVGDIFHDYVRRGSFPVLGRQERLSPRLVRIVPGLKWQGDYGHDMLVDREGQVAFRSDNSVILQHKYWHLTHLERSSADDGTYSSGGSRVEKRRPTYFGIGRRIPEPVPEVFDEAFCMKHRLPWHQSAMNFGKMVMMRILGA